MPADAVVLPSDVAPDAAADVVPDGAGPEAADAFIAPDVSLPQDVVDAMAAPRDTAVDARTAWTVAATGQNATPRRGGSGTGTVDICPDSRLLVGYEGTQNTSGAIQSMVGVCAAVTLPVPGAPATAWALSRLPARGNTGGAPWSRLCPAGHVLVGFDGNAGPGIGQLVLVCAPIALNPSGQAAVLGSDTELDDVGVPANNDFTQTDCPAGQAARGAETRVGSLLEAFGLTCATFVLR